MVGLPDGKGIMAFSDTAGANACLSLAFMLAREGEQIPTLYTNNPNFITNEWELQVNYIERPEQIPERLHAAFLFTGTSHPDSSRGFELRFIRLALQLKIYSVSFIDHWVNFKVRFSMGADIVWPDKIWVLDNKARQAAIAEGLPSEKLEIHENPQHRFLAKYWKPGFNGHGYLHQLGIRSTPDTKVILYAPDPVSLRYKNNELGFDECSALELIIKSLSAIADRSPVLLIIKPHPLQPPDILSDLINESKNGNLECRIIKVAKNTELINCADIIVGFYSNFLLEAQQMNKPIIRYFPGAPSKDPFFHLRDKLPVADDNTIISYLKYYLKYE